MIPGFKIAIVGAGPGGLSAAARAADRGMSHVLLEAAPLLASTLRHYPKGKWVMAEPARLPLRSALGFSAASREEVLASWQHEIDRRQINARTSAEVLSITGQAGDFTLGLANGETLKSEFVLLAIGIQGNLRRLGIPGENLPGIQYQLDDPDQYNGETIVVVGGGDSGVENALVLAERNRVLLINRQAEFSKCREANLGRLKEAVASGRIETWTSSVPERVEVPAGSRFPLSLAVQSPRGTVRLECHRILARLGATPPRSTLERFGIRLAGNDPDSGPELSERYESNIPGLYIIGALAGYPLIKQALNQGYEVIEAVAGSPVEPADQPLLAQQLLWIPGVDSVAGGLDLVRQHPLLAGLTTKKLRKFVLDSEVLTPQPGEVIFRGGDYGNSFFSVLRGSVRIQIPTRKGKMVVFTLPAGDFFGEMGLLSGRRRSGTVIADADCVLVETPRRSMIKLLGSEPAMQRQLDEVALRRIIRNSFGGALDERQAGELVHEAKLKSYALGEVIFREGDVADALYLIRRGSVTISTRSGGKDVVLAYLTAGCYFGEMALVAGIPRTATIRAAAAAEIIMIEAARFNRVLGQNSLMRGEVAQRYLESVATRQSVERGKSGDLVQFLMDRGVGQATDVLLIDYSRCIRCNVCEQACADVHGGVQRLNREAGQTFEMIHIPASCRQCENPQCMMDCPPDAIHRSLSGEVFITEHCLGCGNCQRNCPYGVIHMADDVDYRRPGLWQLLTGQAAKSRRAGPGNGTQKAVKCDMCKEIIGGPACVRACPTGAAYRVSPAEFISMVGH